MTPEELSQLRCLNREIERNRQRLQQMRALAQGKTMTLAGVPNVPLPAARQKLEESICQMEKLVSTGLEHCLALLARIEAFISQQESSEMRLILSLRYVNGLSWQQVAFQIGHYDEQYPRRKHNQFFKNKTQNEGR